MNNIKLITITVLLQFFCYQISETEQDPDRIYVEQCFDEKMQWVLLSSERFDEMKLLERLQFLTALSELVGETYGIDSGYLLAVWYVESRFRRDAIGDDWRSYGLGQVKLRTARYHYDVLIKEQDLFDVVANAFASGKILKDYLDWFGDYYWALVAYNAGSGRIAPYWRNGRKPFNDNYFKRVMKYLEHYV